MTEDWEELAEAYVGLCSVSIRHKDFSSDDNVVISYEVEIIQDDLTVVSDYDYASGQFDKTDTVVDWLRAIATVWHPTEVRNNRHKLPIYLAREQDGQYLAVHRKGWSLFRTEKQTLDLVQAIRDVIVKIQTA